MIFSIGHSSLSADEFDALLLSTPARVLWDIRSYPSSHWPWFARDELERRLTAAGVQYRWVKALGGRRGAHKRPAPPAAQAPPPAAQAPPPAAQAPPPDPAALALFAAPAAAAPRWQSEGFENYMWHMASDEFLAAAGELLLAGRRADVAIMCAEALWWRCHRSMVADFVVYAGGEVVHLQPTRTAHSAASGERFARYAPEVLAAWDRHLAAGGDPFA